MKLLSTRLPPVAVVWDTSTPPPVLPESTLRSLGPVPPIRLLEAPKLMSTPIFMLRVRYVPDGLRPMMLFCTKFAFVPLSVKYTPVNGDPEITLRSAGATSPM